MQELFRQFTREQFHDQNISVFHLEVVYRCLTSCSLNALIITDFVMEFYGEVRTRYDRGCEGIGGKKGWGRWRKAQYEYSDHETRATALHQ